MTKRKVVTDARAPRDANAAANRPSMARLLALIIAWVLAGALERPDHEHHDEPKPRGKRLRGRSGSLWKTSSMSGGRRILEGLPPRPPPPHRPSLLLAIVSLQKGV